MKDALIYIFISRFIHLMGPNFFLRVIGAVLLYTTVYFYVIPTSVETNQTIYCHVNLLSVCVDVCVYAYISPCMVGWV